MTNFKPIESDKQAPKNVIIVGVGALGSHTAMLLRNEAHINIIDFDRIESKNLLSQFHSKIGSGKYKALALQQVMNYLWGVRFGAITNKLERTNVKLLAEGDLVIDCVDNGATRRLIQTFAREHKIPCLHGGLAADAQFGRVVWTERFEIDDEAPGAPTCEDGAALPFIGIVSSYIARAAQVFLRTGKRVGFEISPGGTITT